ncbi:hexokinase [Oxobacter pfennigii]|uniref:Hexokinase n=1 Tax=Oxobacter pfennigii TaxID=36849 RepID=A0A0P9AEM0_9CLOT|nr:hexokinase [Oxobacter pfennigii]KPU43763.1 hexokinase [Oxobacter pfennigii]
MKKHREIVSQFLKKYSMGHESIDMNFSCSTFMREMEQGLEGELSSLKMLPSYLSAHKEILLEEPVIVLDAGGTNFRSAVVHFDKDKKPVIENYSLFPMPGAKGQVSKEEFFGTIIGYIGPLLNKSKKIGFCFSYPSEILPNGDGRLIQFTKEVKVKGLEGEVIGENLLKTMKNQGFTDYKDIVLLNDTAATLLGGKASCLDRQFDSFIGFILGTGTNTCYIEENINIKKLENQIPVIGSMIINIESGGYDKNKRGIIDDEFDRDTANPGEYLHEKMISGRYIGGLISSVIKKGINEGLFSKEFSQSSVKLKEVTTQEMNEFLYYPYGDNRLACYGNYEDKIIIYHIIDSMMERAAKLTAIHLSSIILKTGKGKNPCSPVCIAAEGSLLYKSKLFKDKLNYYVKQFMNDEMGIYCEFIKGEDATLTGAAIAALAI